MSAQAQRQGQLQANLSQLKLDYILENHERDAQKAVAKKWTHLDYLAELVGQEALARQERSIERRIRAAKFPVVKTLAQFNWEWPEKIDRLQIDRLQIEHLMRLRFVEEKANVLLVGGVGLGKTHLATAIAYQACLKGRRTLFANAIEAINNLSAAQLQGSLKRELKKYISPEVLVLDEIGYLPIDQRGADFLFQVISHRYERGSTILTTNKAFKQWASIFNNDATIASAVLDRLLHHATTIKIEGKSYRMKDNIES